MSQTIDGQTKETNPDPSALLPIANPDGVGGYNGRSTEIKNILSLVDSDHFPTDIVELVPGINALEAEHNNFLFYATNATGSTLLTIPFESTELLPDNFRFKALVLNGADAAIQIGSLGGFVFIDGDPSLQNLRTAGDCYELIRISQNQWISNRSGSSPSSLYPSTSQSTAGSHDVDESILNTVVIVTPLPNDITYVIQPDSSIDLPTLFVTTFISGERGGGGASRFRIDATAVQINQAAGTLFELTEWDRVILTKIGVDRWTISVIPTNHP